jgi:hypothetical protein
MIDVDVDDYLEPSLHVDSSLAGVLISHYYILLSIASCGEIYSNMQSRCESVICIDLHQYYLHHSAGIEID